MSFYFRIPGEPKTKQRPRAVVRGNFATIYTPKETKLAEQKLRGYILNNYKTEKLTGAITINIEFRKKLPKKPKTNYWTSKPDIDNMIKLVLDALNGVIYDDDSQITKICANKSYGAESETRIMIEEDNIKILANKQVLDVWQKEVEENHELLSKAGTINLK